MNEKLKYGRHAEELAAAHLVGRGYRILERNFHCRWGEIDIIAQQDETLVFVEVRYRRNSRFGTPSETIDAAKRRRLMRCAQAYLLHGAVDQSIESCRFDVVTVEGSHQDRILEHWIQAW